MRLHTHYDNLKVTRDAPPEVIRAAYHALSRKYHPDLHQGDPDAERAMALINAAYEALSDPLRKGDHDAWIARAEAELERGGGMPASAPGGAHDRTSAPWSRLPRVRLFFGAAVTVAAVAIGIALVGGRSRQYTAEGSADAARPRSDSGVTAGPPLAASAPARLPGVGTLESGDTERAYIRPARAPSGAPWPAASDYVPGFKRLFDDGPGVVEIDNTTNDSDMYVKLYAERDARPFAIRWVFVRARDAFEVKGLRVGRYEARYRALDTGKAAKTDLFQVDPPGSRPGAAPRVIVRLDKPGPHTLPDVDF